MVSQEMLNMLAQITVGIGQPPELSQAQMARQILMRSQISWNVPNYKKPGGGSGGPSVVSRIFDVLSRPNYAVANAWKPVLHDVARHDWSAAIQHSIPGFGGQAGPMWKGITGKDKTTFTKLLTQDPELQQTGLGDLPGPVKAGLGLTLDIGLDPTTYIGIGGFKAGKTGLQAKNVIEDLSKLKTAAPEQIANTKNILETATRATSMAPEGEAAIPALKSAQGVYGPAKGMAPASVKYTPQASAGLKSLAEKMAIGDYKPMDVKVAGKKYGADFTNSMKYAKHVANVGKSPGYYGQVQRAEQLLTRVSEADPHAVATTMPKKPVEIIPATRGEKAMATMISRQAVTKLKYGKDKALNPKQQLGLFRGMLSKTTGSPVERMMRAAAMMRSSESYLKSQGFSFKFWDGTGVKLTDVFDELGHMSKVGPNILKEFETGRINNPLLDQAVEAARVRSAMDDSKFVQLGMDQVTDAAAHAEHSLSPARAESVTRNLQAQLREGLRGARVSPAAVDTASGLFKAVLDSRTPSVQRAMSATAPIAHDIMNARVTRDAKVARDVKIKRAIERHMGSPYRSVETQLGNGNKAVEYLGERFKANYGYSDLRPMAQDYGLSAIANASMRGKEWRNFAKATSLEQRQKGFQAAQFMGRPGALPADPGAIQLGQFMRDRVERLFSSTGIADTAQSVATRAAFTMDDLNKELRKVGSEFQFTRGKVEDQFGAFHDYSKGVDFLKSWETAKIGKQDPIEFITKLELASERLSRQYALMDEVGARFGTTRRMGANQYLAENARLAGHYFPKDVVQQVNRMMTALDDTTGAGNAFTKQVDKVTSAWKSGVTIYAPSHHIRNLIGDTWLSWIAGVNGPKPYYAAARVLRSQRGQYGDSIVTTEKLIAPGAEARALDTPGSIVVRNRSGQGFTAEQIYVAAHQRGLLLNARSLEDIYGEPLMPKIFGGNVQRFAQGSAELREHYVRLAHFIDHISKSKGTGRGALQVAFDDAAHTVRKWHPDGMDLTGFERKYLRRLFPFYSWTRKAFPLVFEAMVTKPGKVIQYPKEMEALQAAMGIEAPSRTDPFPEDQMFPAWIKEKGIGPIAQTGMGGLGGVIAGLSRQGPDGGYTIVNPSNPMVDLMSQFGGQGNPRAPLQGAGSMLNPLARVPIEVTSDKQLFTDVPVSYDPNRYATEQIPGGALASRLTNMGIFGPTERGKKEGIGNPEALLNYGTAAGVMGTGPYIKQAGYEQKARDRADRKARLAKFLSQYNIDSGGG